METIHQPNHEAHGSLQTKKTEFIEQDKKNLQTIIKGLKEKFFPVSSHQETLPQIQAIDRAVEELTNDTLRKVGSQLGSNEGGWYEQPSSGERFYLKFYENPDQAKVEFIANSIYTKLGIKTVQSDLIEVDGRPAISSPEIPNSQPTYREDQKSSPDVRDGFVADAYLANWDVVGLNYDNIMQGEDGMYRVDNGGSLTFRAQGGAKEYSPHDIPELRTMLNPDFTAGQVFEGITKQEMAQQAKKLVDTLDVATIDAIIAESALTGEAASTVREGLVGRRDFLIERFNLRSRLHRVIEELRRNRDSIDKLGLRSREVVISDSHHLENQEVNFIDARDKGMIIANFKLTAAQYASVLQRLESQNAPEGLIQYSSVKDDGFSMPLHLSDAYKLDHNGLTVSVATGTKEYFYDSDERVRSALGLVIIEIPYGDDNPPSTEEIEERVNDILINVLGVTEGLAQPTEEAEREYKRARYLWHNKIIGPLTSEQHNEVEKLERREVFPGYYTMVAENKHRDYEKTHGEFALYHNVSGGPDRIVEILKNQGLLSAHERFRRGLLREGMSTISDFNSGGADSVFTRTIVEGAQSDSYYKKAEYYAGGIIILSPELYDRTDWYAYNNDQFGETKEAVFEKSLSPEEVFTNQKTGGFTPSNEQMFRTGISSRSFKGIGCEVNVRPKSIIGTELGLTGDEINALWDKGPAAVREALVKKNIADKTVDGRRNIDTLFVDHRMTMIDKLQQAGFNEINGIPVAQFVVEVRTVDDFIDVAHGRPPRSSLHSREDNLAFEDTTAYSPYGPLGSTSFKSSTPTTGVYKYMEQSIDYDLSIAENESIEKMLGEYILKKYSLLKLMDDDLEYDDDHEYLFL